jgi:transposase InsO family protein
VLAETRRAADAAGTDWKTAVYRNIQNQREKGSEMSALRMCDLGHVSRAGFYRFDPKAKTADDSLDLRDEIQQIALAFPYYGRPRITAELRRRGWEVNHKRVGRIMREDNLLCLRRRKFVATTDSNHNLRVYPNLAKDRELTGIDQLWRADITYIRLETEFVYLAVVLDAFSRRVIGWALDRNLEDDLAIAALHGLETAQSLRGADTSLGPGRPVRIKRLYESAQRARYPHQYEPERQSL